MKFEEIYKKVLDADKKFKKLGIPINLEFKIEDLRDALIESNDKIEELKYINKRLEDAISPIKKDRDALRNENAYLRRLALHALSGWAMGMSMANAYLPKGTRKKQIDYFMVFKKFENLHNIEKDKWRKEKAESYK